MRTGNNRSKMKKLYKNLVKAIHKWHGTRRCLKRIARIREAGNEVVIAPEDVLRVKLSVDGKGNFIRVGKLHSGDGKIRISVYGDDCRVDMGGGLVVGEDLQVFVGLSSPGYGKVKDCSVSIGSDTFIASGCITLASSHSSVAVGANCMFSFDTVLYQTDAHPIYELGTDRIVNIPRSMTIGDHVWLGKGVTVLKNSVIPNGCIVGWGSVVSGKFTEPNSIICGNPARQIEGRKVDWRRRDPRYITNE